jgi:hypothetical protein
VPLAEAPQLVVNSIIFAIALPIEAFDFMLLFCCCNTLYFELMLIFFFLEENNEKDFLKKKEKKKFGFSFSQMPECQFLFFIFNF